MSLNLDNYKDSLVGAWRDVMNEKSPTNWAIFGYEGQTFDLKLISSGADGIEEMNEDFNSGKIMYGLCRVRLEEKNVEKIALINWQGEGAPLARKGTCANHVSTIKNFFKGIHVTINARADEDVDPAAIIAAVSKATSGSGVRMSSSMESDVATPVGATYKRVNPQEEINSQAKNDFWLKEEKEEERRKKEEQSRIHKFSRNEVQLLRKESQDYFNEADAHNDVFTPSSASPISPNPQSQNGTLKINGDAFNHVTSPRTVSPVSSSGRSNGLFVTSLSVGSNEGRNSASPIPTVTNSFVASEKAAALKASLPRKSANENLVRQRIKSFDGNNFEKTYNSVTTNGGSNSVKNGASTERESESESLSVLRKKQMFENGGPSPTTRIPSRLSVSDEIKQLQQESLKAQQKNQELETQTQAINNRTPSPQIQTQALDHQRQIVSPVRTKSPSPQPVQTQFPFQSKTATATSTHSIKAYNLPFHIGGSVTGKLAEKVNKSSENGIGNTNGNHIGKGVAKQSPAPGSIEPPESFNDRSNHVTENQLGRKTSPTTQSVNTPSPTPVAAVSPTINSNESSSPQPLDDHSSPTKSIEITPEMGLCARALYDYQAADDTEITFDPGEIITNIERIDEGWWEGLGPQGMYGLFPANYVELLN